MDDRPLTLLCLSHLRWDHVWQRPQQLMSRFAKHARVIFVDPPELSSDVRSARVNVESETDGVEVLRPLFPADVATSSPAAYEQLWTNLLPDVLARAGNHTILWVFSPHADYLVAAARQHTLLVVYDCMDDLASFRFADADLRMREDRLLALVALVFTGGRSMYEARKDRHPHVSCFPSGVDVAHYRPVGDTELTEPGSIQHLAHPRLGYFGVLDERIDWTLIAEVARRRPEWQWLLVGPTAKVDPAELPTAPNIHYFGQQPYAELPRFLKGFDIATMPFALNEATRFISPTKTLEYLAGGKPVVSSSVPDVVATYQDIVALADGTDAWITAIEQLRMESGKVRRERLERAEPLLHAGSWDGITEQMWTLIAEQLHATTRESVAQKD